MGQNHPRLSLPQRPLCWLAAAPPEPPIELVAHIWPLRVGKRQPKLGMQAALAPHSHPPQTPTSPSGAPPAEGRLALGHTGVVALCEENKHIQSARLPPALGPHANAPECRG